MGRQSEGWVGGGRVRKGKERKGERVYRERLGRARLGYVSRDPEFLVTPLLRTLATLQTDRLQMSFFVLLAFISSHLSRLIKLTMPVHSTVPQWVCMSLGLHRQCRDISHVTSFQQVANVTTSSSRHVTRTDQ